MRSIDGITDSMDMSLSKLQVRKNKLMIPTLFIVHCCWEKHSLGARFIPTVYQELC